jgi:hypothetical protein
LSTLLVNDRRPECVIVRIDPDEVHRPVSHEELGSSGVAQTCVCPFKDDRAIACCRTYRR